MNRLQLSDELPYRFQAPRLNPLCLAYGRLTGRRMLRRDHRIEEFDFAGLDERLRPLLGRDDAVLIAPNHTDHADSHLLFEVGRRLGLPFYYMAAYQIFQGGRGWFLPRVGCFPVDREGTDLTAFKMGVDLLTRARNPLVIFPEGEIHHLNDRLTPLREGALAIAATAAKRLAESGKTVWVVPVALKYRYLESHDCTPALHEVMEELERRATWFPQRHRALADRIYHYANGMINLKEYEYLGAPRQGTLPDRLIFLRDAILQGVESRRAPGGRAIAEDRVFAEKVKTLRKACLDTLADEKTNPAERAVLKKDLHDLFVASQISCYPGDYLRECPTVERAAETLMKFEEDFLGVFEVKPHGPRRAVLRVGEPIDVGARLAVLGKPRVAVPSLTTELETRLQGLLDSIGPGRLLEPAVPETGSGTENISGGEMVPGGKIVRGTKRP